MLRHAPPPELASFDLPAGVEVTGKRNVTTLPTQSLYLLNSPFVVAQAEKLAQRLLAGDGDDAERIDRLFRWVLQRNPTSDERRSAAGHLRAVEASLGEVAEETDDRETRAWASLCQGLIATNEFRYVD